MPITKDDFKSSFYFKKVGLDIQLQFVASLPGSTRLGFITYSAIDSMHSSEYLGGVEEITNEGIYYFNYNPIGDKCSGCIPFSEMIRV